MGKGHTWRISRLSSDDPGGAYPSFPEKKEKMHMARIAGTIPRSKLMRMSDIGSMCSSSRRFRFPKNNRKGSLGSCALVILAAARLRFMKQGYRAGHKERIMMGLKMVADEVEEELVDTWVDGKLRVEGGGKEMAFTDKHRELLSGGEDFDVRAGTGDSGGADEDHF
jgi:hypothetical protein